MRYDAESMNTILVVLAHPDDETFIFGGTIAKYSKLGFPLIGNNSFAITLVRGSILVPSPASGIIACFIIRIF